MPRKAFQVQKEAGATSIMMATFVVMVIFVIALSAAAIMIYQMKMSGEIANSIPAFYAADSAAEKCLYQVRKGTPGGSDCTSLGIEISVALNNGSSGRAMHTLDNQLVSWGIFAQTQRNLQLDWAASTP